MFAATSLTDAFNKISAQFEKANPGVSVKINYNGSSSLATQITQGAPADVFASASPTNMKAVTDAGDATGTPQVFTVLVTHDLLDAVALGDRMIVIEHGQIVQTGTPAEVTAQPRPGYVADLTGVNLLRGTGHGTLLELDGGGQLTCAEPATGPVLAVITPAAVSVSRQRPEAQQQNTWPGQISAVDLMGDRVRVRMDGTLTITAEVPPAAVDELKLDDGGELWATVAPAAVTVYPP